LVLKKKNGITQIHIWFAGLSRFPREVKLVCWFLERFSTGQEQRSDGCYIGKTSLNQ